MPSVQRAVLLAVAGTDRYERVDPGPDATPAGALCVDCDQGSGFHQAVTISEKCTEHGHTPFGYPTGTTWTQAQARVASDQQRWQSGQPGPSA